jgi:hypothetical protein
MSALPHKADIDARDCDVRFVPMGDIERFFELKEVANRGLISRRYPTVVSAGPFCELDDFRTDGCLKEPTRRSGPFLSTYRCRSFGRMAPWDFCHPLQEPDSAGPVSDYRRAADPASDPTVDLADRADSGSSWRFLSWERAYNGSQFGFVPDKEKCDLQWRNYLSLTYSDLRLLIYIFLSSGTAPRRSNLIRQQTPGVPISLYEHTSTARRTSGNRCFGATIGCEHH